MSARNTYRIYTYKGDVDALQKKKVFQDFRPFFLHQRTPHGPLINNQKHLQIDIKFAKTGGSDCILVP
jgi:hypothetical protein